MPRLMSVMHTVDAVVERRKRVTRRAGWHMLAPGDRLTLCRKVMGRRKGEPLDRLAEVVVVSTRREPLNAITDDDVALEGFAWADLDGYTCAEEGTPGALATAFCRFFVDKMGGSIDQTVTRVEWEYLPHPIPQGVLL